MIREDEKVDVNKIFEEVEKRGIVLKVDDNNLKFVAPKGSMTKELLEKIKTSKKQIINRLKEIELENDKSILFEPISKIDNKKYYDLSAQEKRMYVVNKLEDKSTAYNTTLTIKIKGIFDIDKFKSIFTIITERHESFRTTFGMIDGEPKKYIHDKVEFDVPFEETDGGEEDVERIIKDYIKPYNLEKLPLFRTKLIKSNKEDASYLVIDIHHIISDGVSGAIIVDEMNKLYNGIELKEQNIHYKDYAVWHEKLLSTPFMKKEKEFFLNQLSGELPVLDMPTDFKRPSVFSNEGESLHLEISEELTAKLKMYTRKHKVTLFTLIFAAFNVLLSKYTSKDDIIVGSPVAGRIHEDTYSMCGIFLNTIPLRNYPSKNKQFKDFVYEVSKNCLRSFDNQDYPFDELLDDLKIERDSSRNPIFSTMFVMQNMATDDLRSSDFNSKRYDIKHKMAQVDITVNATELDKTIDFEFNYCTKLFKTATIKRMLEHYENILNSVCDNEEIIIEKIDMLSSNEKNKLLVEFNNNKVMYEDKTFHGLFEEQVALNPDKTAIYFKSESISFSELNKKANSLAHTLILKGVKNNDIVALLCESSIEMAISMLAVLKAGGAYLTIKTDLPKDRIKFMLNDSSVRVVLVTPENIEKIDGPIEIINVCNKTNYSINTENPNVSVPLNSLAYVIYTSGTTGTPKGVMIEHGSISKTMQWRKQIYGLNKDDCVAELFSYAFDGFIAAFYTVLLAGGSTILFEKNAEKDPNRVKHEILSHKVTRILCVPMLFAALNESMSAEDLSNIKSVTLAADKTPSALIENFKNKCKGIQLVNEYGPTECSIVSTINLDMRTDNCSNIGFPADNTSIYILDENKKPQPIGVPGELWLSGPRLARGYINRPELNEQKFMQNPFEANERLYNTGDVARWMEDGTVDFIGRSDFQVKIRGFRVEPAEIEAEISKYQAVKENVVIDRLDEAGNKYLCSYIVRKNEIKLIDLRNFLLKSLPEYEIPSRFVFLDKIPLTANGKLDRKALPKPDDSIDIGTEYKSAQTMTEVKLEKIWSKLLGIKDIGINNNFFEIGGDSMKIIKLHESVDKEFPGIVTVTDLFSYSTIKRLGEYIDSQIGSDDQNNEEEIINEDVDSKENDDIAIIGISVNLPKSKSIKELRNTINNKINCVCDMPESRKNDAIQILKSRKGNIQNIEFEKIAYLDEIDKFDPQFFKIAPSEVELMDPNQRQFLQSAYSAIEDAGLSSNMMKKTKTGVFVGFGGESDYGTFIAKENPKSYSIAAAGNLSSVIPARISYYLDLKGPAMVINTACSSSLVAIHEACNSIKKGECDMALAGGVKLWLDSIKDEYSIGIESDDNKTRTFDENSCGTGKGEGVGVVLLKPLKRAVEDGNSIYAVIKGSAINQDGTSNGITAPNPLAQSEVIKMSLRNAKINPEDVGLIEAHGTGTKLGDPIEIDGLTKAFRKFTNKKQYCAITAVKTNFGHLDNSAGVVGIIKTAVALKYNELPPIANFTAPNRAIDFVNSPIYINNTYKKWEENHSHYALVSAFGLSGTNCNMVLGEAPKQVSDDSQKPCEIMTFSAMNKEVLINIIDNTINAISEDQSTGLRDICYTLNTGRNQYNSRAAVIIDNKKSEVKNTLIQLKECVEENKSSRECFYNDIKILQNSENNGVNGITQSYKQELTNQAEKKIKNSEKQDYNELKIIADLFIKGADIDFSELYKSEKRLRVNLPTYPFERKRCWTSIKAKVSNSVETRYYAMKWDEAPSKGELKPFKNKIIVIQNHENKSLINALTRKCDNISIFDLENDKRYMSNLSDIKLNNNDKIIVSLSFRGDISETYLPIMEIAKLISQQHVRVDIDFVSECVSQIEGEFEKVIPENSIIFGIGKSLALENKNISCRFIDTDKRTSKKIIANTVLSKTNNSNIAFRNNKQYFSVLRPIVPISDQTSLLSYKGTGVYIITGGTGSLGLELARLLAKKGSLNIALLSRTGLDYGENCKSDIMLEIEKINKSTTSNIFVLKCDITNKEILKDVLKSLRKDFKRINGIINCAAVNVGKLSPKIEETSENEFSKIISPKVYGTMFLNELTKRDNLDFFVNYSSNITIMGGAQIAAYTAANSYLDSFAEFRASKGTKTLTIDWPYFIKDKGNVSGDVNKLMFMPVLASESLAIIEELLQKKYSRVVVGKLNYNSGLLKLCGKMPFNICDELRANLAEDNDRLNFRVVGRENNSYTETEVKIAKVFSKTLGLEAVNIFDDFFEIGGNSLVAIKFESYAEEENLSLTSEDVYEYKTVSSLANHIKDDSCIFEETTKLEPETKELNANTTKIENIKPFNDVFFESCFYNSFFPVVKHYGYSINTYLINDVPSFKREENSLTITYNDCEDIEELMKSNGINITTMEFSNDIIAKIKDELLNDNPVIAWVDCFYETIRQDTYQKTHWPHSILIYGFDDCKKEFLIIEHKLKDNLSYSEKVIPFDSLYNMLEGYQKRYYTEFKKPCINIFEKSETKVICDYKQRYKENLEKKFEIIKVGLEKINDYCSDISNNLDDEKVFFKNSSTIIASLNDIINSKDAEIYKLKSIMIDDSTDIIERLKELKEDWSMVRRIIAKCVYSSHYDLQKINKAKTIIKHLPLEEEKFINNLVNSLK